MDLILGNLAALKRRLLPSTMLAQATYDAVITQIGRGVGSLFDRHCNRELVRVAGAVDQFSADRMSWVLRRYPVESITSIEARSSMTDGWVALSPNDVIRNRDDEAGLVRFGAVQGDESSELRITYTGGYWVDTSEDGSAVQPPGATALPFDLVEAWYLQCEAAWGSRDKLGAGLVKDSNREAPILGLDIVPKVKRILEKHVRMQIT